MPPAKTGPPLLEVRKLRGRMASPSGSGLAGLKASNGWPQTSQQFCGAHARCTTLPQGAQNLPSVARMTLPPQTVHLLPAICIGRLF